MSRLPENPAEHAAAEGYISGADLLVKTLKACGVDFVFMEEHLETKSIAESLSREDTIRLINPVSEISCVPMADACTRYTGKPVVSITAGGGHCLNQVMGLTTAWGDKSPVISIGVCKEVAYTASPIFDREHPDMDAVFSSISVYHAKIRQWEQIPEIIKRGARESMSAKGGTVHVEIPLTILETLKKPDDAWHLSQSDPLYRAQVTSPPMGDPKKIQNALSLLLGAERPIIFVGGGVIKANAVFEINELARKTGIPILSGMGALDGVYPDNPMYIGPSSYTGGEAFHGAIKKADVVLAVGACFSGLDGFGLPPIWSGDIKFIQVNIDHQYIALNPNAHIAIVADARHVVKQMLKRIDESNMIPDRSEWVSRLKQKNREHKARLFKEAVSHKNKDGQFHPALSFIKVKKIIESSDALTVVDGGNTCLWAGMSINMKGPKRVFFPTGMATLGVGIPMALGLKAAAGDKPVVLVTGDGSLLYNIQELELIKKYNLPIIIVVNNDSAWNMIRAGEVMVNRAISTELPRQNYTEVAKSFGIDVKRITHKEEIASVFRKALEKGGPMLIDVPTDKDVYPDSLVSFIRVEFMGTLTQPFKKLRELNQSKVKLFSRNTLNIIRFLIKTI